jgi:hypothetical protein
MSATKLAGLVLVGALFTSTGCGLTERLDPCGALFDELQAVGRKLVYSKNGRDSFRPLSAADAPFFRDAASKVRRLGKRLDKDGPAETREIAAGFDKVAETLESLPPGSKTTKHTDAIGGSYDGHINNETLKAACGYPPASGY